MTDIIPLQQNALSTLFEDELRASTRAPLAQDLAAKAVRMSKAGADAAAIAQQLNVWPSQVSTLLRERSEAEHAAAAARKEAQQQLVYAGTAPPAASNIAQAPEESQLSPEPIAGSESAPPANTALAPESAPAEWLPDIEISALKRQMIRHMRRRLRFSLEKVAKAFRSNPAQIARICEEPL